MRHPEQRGEVDRQGRGGAPLEAGADHDGRLVVAAAALGGGELDLGLGADGELLVDDGEGDAAVYLVGVLALAAGLELGDEVDAPVDAAGELVAEQELELDRVGV